MIKQEIIEKISKFFRLTEFEAERVYDDIFSIIMSGVKEDNVVDVSNLGEFIIKHETGETGSETVSMGYEKNVEFLPSSVLEDELNQGTSGWQPIQRFMEPQRPSEIEQSEIEEHEINQSEIEQPAKEQPEIEQPTMEQTEIKQPEIKQSDSETPRVENTSGTSIEEELRRRREEILSKITGPIFSETSQTEKEEAKGEEIPQAEEEEQAIKQDEDKEEPVKTETNEQVAAGEKTSGEKTGLPAELEEDLSHKSFSDYFSEVSPEGKTLSDEKPVERVKESVIPESAVLLHNEITAPPAQETASEQPEQAPAPVMEKSAEHRAIDNSYYIWYKDSESNPIDTQTLSYEYELLYQATKEAEYKSKLKIYVTTFILFFSLVLALLIFSPILYKIFFSPGESDIPGIESIQEETPDVSLQKAIPNVIQDSPPQTQQGDSTKAITTPQTGTEKNQQSPPITQDEKITPQQLTSENADQQQPKVETKLEGVTKNAVGWVDAKNKVIYIQLENGKYAIQESSWNSEGKANARISMIESLGIKDLNGSTSKIDLGAKGMWFRVRLGGFSTLEEARKKAEELNTKRAGRF
jgi:nucleoid DNA-binding protein